MYTRIFTFPKLSGQNSVQKISKLICSTILSFVKVGTVKVGTVKVDTVKVGTVKFGTVKVGRLKAILHRRA